MKHEMTMPRPAPRRVGRDEKTDALCRLYHDCVQASLKAAVRIFQLAPHAVQVHRVSHHGVVMQDHTQALAVTEMHRCRLPEFDAIEGLVVTLHVASQVQLDLAFCWP